MFKTKSSLIALLLNFRIEDILCPWKLFIDFENKLIITKKRNWYLVGTDNNIIPWSNIRNIYINEHFFGADVHIKIYGATISAYYLPKSDAKKIKNYLTIHQS
jgi:hypothetical protein